MINKRRTGQVWIETVIYTIIGLALIGTVLAFVSPKISETRDKIVVEQSIEAMQTLDAKVQEVIGEGIGSKRVIQEFNLKRGDLTVDPAKGSVILKISDLKTLYSESGSTLNFGRVALTSRKGQKVNEVEMVLSYSAPIRYSGLKNSEKLISAASTPYKISIENKKDASSGVNYINLLIER